MRKITWDFLSIELTRKCQLNCRHCFRGHSQNLSIAKDSLDLFLKQTEIIGMLHFTGGEPTLAVEEMRYILDKLYEYRIPLFRLQVITNGYVKSEEFVQIVKDYSDMIRICYLEADIDMKYYVTIGVSIDRYYEGYDPNETLKYYKKELKGYAKVIPMTDGNIPVRSGNANSLPEALNQDEKERLDTRVEILTKDIKPMCPNYKTYNIVHDEQVYVVCEMSLTAKGDITLYRICSNSDYDYEDKNIICNIHNVSSIYDAIIQYNKDKCSCLEKMKKRKIKEEKRKNDPAKLLKDMMQVIRMQSIVGSTYEDMVTFLANKHISDPIEYAENIIDDKIVDVSNLESKDIDGIIKQVQEYNYCGGNDNE